MSQRVLLLGGTGFVGRELGQRLAQLGHRVVLAARNPDRLRGTLPFPCELHAWPDVSEPVPIAALTGCDAVVNLVGEGIADRPWTRTRRIALRDSRTASIKALSASLRQMTDERPKVVIQASAVGYYGNRREEELTEASPPGDGFLAETCQAWERHDLAQLVSRVVTMRFGLVLGMTGGALPKLLGIYAKGFGAVLGSGRQWVSWIHVDDLVAMITTALGDSSWRGVVNATAPKPCRFKDFNTALARHGRYPANKKVPAAFVKLAMGRRSVLVLDSAKILPAAATSRAFQFRFDDIDACFAGLLRDTVGPKMRRLITRQWVPESPTAVWSFFSSAQNLERLTPVWLGFKLLTMSTPTIGEGTRIKYSIRLHGVPLTWESLIKNWTPDRLFIDEQVRGPYDVWHHEHKFEPLAGGTLMTEDVQYRLPLGRLGETVAGLYVERDVAKIFDFRRRVIARMWAS